MPDVRGKPRRGLAGLVGPTGTDGLQYLDSYEPTREDRLWNFVTDRVGNDNLGRGLAALNTYATPWGIAGLTMDALDKGDYQGAALAVMPLPPGGSGLKNLAKSAAKAGARKAKTLVEEAIPVVKNAVTPAAAPARNMTALPDIRRMTTAEGVAATAGDPHLIPKPDGGFVGGPRNVRDRAGLGNLRRGFDDFVGADPRGADWYDRYRAGVSQMTGNQPLDNLWSTQHLAAYSPQRPPAFELNATLKEGNSAIMGMPVRPNTASQHEAFLAATEANDLSAGSSPKASFGLGKKTGEYAFKNNPDNVIDHATGTNDFRHARNLGYTEVSGEAAEGSMNPAQHKFMDYETAAAVGRANKAGTGGITDWTGPKLQAAPWVRQKAQDLVEQRNLVNKYLEQGNAQADAERLAYDEAFEEANKTVADAFPKHTAFATYEAQPGANIPGHMEGSSAANKADRDAFFHDPRSDWALAPGGRDAIYGGLRLGETGIAGRVLPTQNMQGMYTDDAGKLTTDLGAAARPLVAFNNLAGGTKELPPADRAMLEGGEALRALIGGQEAGAAHKVWFGGKVGDSNSVFIPRDMPSTPEEMLAIKGVTGLQGLNDIVDTGQGLTATQFYGGAPEIKSKDFGKMTAGLEGLKLPTAGVPERAKVDSIYEPLGDMWRAGEGSGEVTKYVMGKLNINPTARAAFNNNPYIPQAALNHMERDAEWGAKWGIPRADLQNLREIISQGPGWMDRLDDAVKAGKIALPAFVGLMGATNALSGQSASTPAQQ